MSGPPDVLAPELILERVPVGVMVIDPDTVVKWANEHVLREFGYEKEEVVGRSILDFIDAEWDPVGAGTNGFSWTRSWTPWHSRDHSRRSWRCSSTWPPFLRSMLRRRSGTTVSATGSRAS